MKTIQQLLKCLPALALILVCPLLYGQGFSSSWDNGFKIKNPDQNLEFKFGGRINIDAAYLIQEDTVQDIYPAGTNGIYFRRARLFHSGKLWNTVDYKLQIDFSDQKVGMKDAYIRIHGIPALGSITVGHFKEPMRNEILTSGKYITFLERSLPSQLFVPERNVGIMFSRAFENQPLKYSLGLFKSADKGGNDVSSDSAWNVTGRLEGLLAENQDRLFYLHGGVSGSYRNLIPSYNFAGSVSSESKFAPKYANYSVSNADGAWVCQVDVSGAVGPFWWYADFIWGSPNVSVQNNPNLSAYTAQLGYFLTKEHRKVDVKKGGFKRITPNKAYNAADKCGAWEVAIRQSATLFDTDHSSVSAQNVSITTLGLNWYLNSATRLGINYGYADIEDLGGANIIQARIGIDF